MPEWLSFAFLGAAIFGSGYVYGALRRKIERR